MEEKKLVPKRRFSEFEGEWEARILDTGVKKIGDGIHGTPKYTLDGEVYFINGNNLLNGSIIFNKDNKKVDKDTQTSNDKLLDKNTVLMSINGTIGLLARYQGEDIMLGKSVAYIILNDFKRDYVYYYLKRNQVQKYFTNTLTGSTIKNLSLGAIRMTKIWVPNILEQQKIGKFFKVLDERIANQERKIAKVKALKEAYLTEMFPQEGETVPKRRFDGFDGEWNYVQLAKIANIIGGGTPSTTNSKYWNGAIDWYSPTEIGKNVYAIRSEKRITELGLQKSSATILPANKTILFTSRAGIGDAAILTKDAATNQGFQSIVVKINVDTYFIYSITHKIKEYALINATGSTFLEVSGKTLEKMNLCIPSYEEQQKIGQFFKNLDDQIQTEEAKLEKLKKTKEAYLEEMFV